MTTATAQPPPEPPRGPVAVELRQLAEVGQQLALAPLQLPLRLSGRLLGALAEPVREGVRRDLRHAVGLPAHGRPRPVTDPGRAFLPPGSVARRVHADLPAMVVGGLSALLLQALHPLAMAGVAEHSNYAEDALGRLRRTAAFVGATTYGSRAEAERAIDKVREVHHRVRGVAPDGRPYSAADPELVTWVHVAEMASFLEAGRRYGGWRPTPAECDAYLAETAPVAFALGAEWVPRTTAEVDAYFRRMRPELYAGPQARAARDFLLRGVATKPDDRLVYTVVAAGAVSLLPRWARAELGLAAPPLVDALAVRPVVGALCAGLRWAAPPPADT